MSATYEIVKPELTRLLAEAESLERVIKRDDEHGVSAVAGPREMDMLIRLIRVVDHLARGQRVGF